MGEVPCYAHSLADSGRMPDPPEIRLRRAYEPAPMDEPARARRVLVDRVWPRGIKKEQLDLAAWLPNVAPTHALRRWYGHDPERWTEFRHRYCQELTTPDHRDALQTILDLAYEGPVVLLFGAKDPERNQAVVLRDVLLKLLSHDRP